MQSALHASGGEHNTYLHGDPTAKLPTHMVQRQLIQQEHQQPINNNNQSKQQPINNSNHSKQYDNNNQSTTTTRTTTTTTTTAKQITATTI